MIPIVTAFVAIALPLYIMSRAEKRPVRRPWLWSIGSMASAMAALCQEIFTFWRRASNSDVSGILDTAGAVLIISIALVVITLALNLLAMFIYDK